MNSGERSKKKILIFYLQERTQRQFDAKVKPCLAEVFLLSEKLVGVKKTINTMEIYVEFAIVILL